MPGRPLTDALYPQVVEKIEINNAIVSQTWKFWI